MRERKSLKLVDFALSFWAHLNQTSQHPQEKKKVKENEKFICRIFGVNSFIFRSLICFYFTTLPLNKHQSRATILLCSLVIVKPNCKMKILFSPFGYITWKVNYNWIRNKKKCQNIPLGKKLDELTRARTTKDVLNQFFIFCHVL